MVLIAICTITKYKCWWGDIIRSNLNTGSHMSAHVLLNLLNELEKMIRCKAMSSILSVSPTSLINSMKKVSISNAK